MAAEKDGVCGRGAQAPLAQKKLIPPKRICLVMIRCLAAAVVCVFAEASSCPAPFRFARVSGRTTALE